MTKKEMVKETRYLSDFTIEKREEAEDGKMILEGYAAVYDSPTRIGGDDWGFEERIEKGAFEEADLRDVPLKYNHTDAVPILARTRNKSLVLTPDEKGLKIRAELLDTQDGIDMYKRVKAGLIDKMSFAFSVADDDVQYDDDGFMHRSIRKFGRIFDVSVVDTPAYDETSVFARSKELAEARRAEADAQRKVAEEKKAGQPINYQARALALAYKKEK